MSVPGNYDTTWLYVHPSAVDESAALMYGSVFDICCAIRFIQNIVLDPLFLSWAGTSAAEAHDLTQRWTHMLKVLFGTEDGHDPGVLGKVVDGLYRAAANYTSCEHEVKKMFTSFADNMSGNGGGPDVSGEPELPVGVAGASLAAGMGGEIHDWLNQMQPHTDEVTNGVDHSTSVNEKYSS